MVAQNKTAAAKGSQSAINPNKKARRDGGDSAKEAPAMLMTRLILRLKSSSNSFREWKLLDIGKKKDAGFVEVGRFFGTSNGYQLTKPIAIKLGEEIVNALHLGQRSRASDLLSELGSEERALKVRSFIPILQYCAGAPDPLFVLETWKLMTEKDVRLSGKCYFFTIKALCKGGNLDEAFTVLSIQRAHSDISPTLRVYNYLLKASVRINSLNHVNEVLHLMEQEGMLKDTLTYSHLIKLAVLQQSLSEVHGIWKDCVNYYSLSIIILRKFIWAFTRLRDLKSANMALQQMVATASQHKVSTIGTYEKRLCISTLDVPIPFSDDLARDRYIRSNRTSVCYSPLQNKENGLNKGVRYGTEVRGITDAGSEQPFSTPVMKLLTGCFDMIISACGRSRNFMFAEQLMLQMRILGLEPSSRTYNGYIRALISVKTFHDGMEVLNVMQQRNMKPSDSTLAALSVSCCRSLQLDLAETFLDQISKICNHVNLFNEFLRACHTVDNPERAIRVWARVKNKNLMPNIRTYELLFSLFGDVSAPYDKPSIQSQADAAKRINAIEMDMLKHGIQHNLFSLQNLLKALGREKMIKELTQYVRVAEEQCIYKSTSLGIQIYNTFLHSLVKAKETHTAIEIFKKMISCGLSPNTATYGIMMDCCSIINCYTSACALISRIIRDGFPINVVMYTCLVKILSKCGAFGEAFRLLDLASSEAVRPDVALYNTILKIASQKNMTLLSLLAIWRPNDLVFLRHISSLFCLKLYKPNVIEGRIDVIELIVEKLHRLRIQPDPSTCRHVFSAYFDNGFQSTAMEALQVMSLRMISERADILEEYRLKYENVILDEERNAEFEIIKLFSSPFLVVALLNLRWCAILESPPSWLPDQSPWAKRLSSDYAARLHG